ncbi:MAG: hypothetical protein KAS32_04855 [Candidatus Peribacteraceae bacterium]|nr:hypothetical protein [Candidatus Peribacteraceae bacterium]
MKSVCIQVGHWQCESLTAKYLRNWRSAEILRRSTGASGERDYHWHKVMPLLTDLLIAKGIQVYLTGSIWDDIYKRDFDLWVSLHYDGGGSENRCMVSAPIRSAVPAFLNDKAQRESERFCAIWKSIYPEITGTINRDERITEGMLWYYAFDFVPLDTPAVIIEHFNHTSEKGKELKGKPELVAEADYKAILKFLDIPEKEPSRKYEVHHQDKKIAEYDFDITKKLKELETNLKNKITEHTKLSEDFEKYKVKKAKEISELNISHINYKTQTEKVINTKKGEILDLGEDIKGLNLTIKELKKRPSNLNLYSGWDLIGLGILKLLKREKPIVKEVKENGK